MIFFLLGYNKTDKKFSELEIVESSSKEIWSLSYATSMIHIIFCLDVCQSWDLGLLLLFCQTTEQSKIILPIARTTKNYVVFA